MTAPAGSQPRPPEPILANHLAAGIAFMSSFMFPSDNKGVGTGKGDRQEKGTGYFSEVADPVAHRWLRRRAAIRDSAEAPPASNGWPGLSMIGCLSESWTKKGVGSLCLRQIHPVPRANEIGSSAREEKGSGVFSVKPCNSRSPAGIEEMAEAVEVDDHGGVIQE